MPVIDHWWQTETGWPIAANCLGLEPLPVKPGSPTKPVPGYDVRDPRRDGRAAAAASKEGAVVIRLPLPPGHAADALERRRALRRDATSRQFPGYYAPATAATSTRTATSTSWGASTTSSTSPATACRPGRWRQVMRRAPRRRRMRRHRRRGRAEGRSCRSGSGRAEGRRPTGIPRTCSAELVRARARAGRAGGELQAARRRRATAEDPRPARSCAGPCGPIADGEPVRGPDAPSTTRRSSTSSARLFRAPRGRSAARRAARGRLSNENGRPPRPAALPAGCARDSRTPASWRRAGALDLHGRGERAGHARRLAHAPHAALTRLSRPGPGPQPALLEGFDGRTGLGGGMIGFPPTVPEDP